QPGPGDRAGRARREPARRVAGRRQRLLRLRRAQRRAGLHQGVNDSMTVTDSPATQPTEPAPTTPVRLGPRKIDPREPEVRLAALLDPGSIVPLHPADTSGVQAVRGRIDGAKVIVYCTDATRQGGAMGFEGCRHIVDA